MHLMRNFLNPQTQLKEIEKTRTQLEKQRDEERDAIEEKLRLATLNRDENLKKKLERLKEHVSCLVCVCTFIAHHFVNCTSECTKRIVANNCVCFVTMPEVVLIIGGGVMESVNFVLEFHVLQLITYTHQGHSLSLSFFLTFFRSVHCIKYSCQLSRLIHPSSSSTIQNDCLGWMIE